MFQTRIAYVRFILQNLLLLISCTTFLNAQSITKPVKLQCEYLTTPLGIDNPHPRFTWQLNEGSTSRQTAYQVSISTDSTFPASPKTWSSERSASPVPLFTYTGTTLQPFTTYFWKVTVFGNGLPANGAAAVSKFETGMMDAANWQGAWISDNQDKNAKPSAYYRKEFPLHKKIRKARAYIAAAGLYELTINGSTISNHFLDPMYTRFDRRVLYVTHDVTAQLQQGGNAIGVLLGNGWYNHQSTAVWNFHHAPWRNRPAFCLDLLITYEDGSTEIIATDKSWKTTNSPVVFNSIYTAEHYDVRNELPGWNRPGYDDKNWKDVIYRAAPAQQVVSQSMHPIVKVRNLPAVTMRKFSDTCYVFDLGENISGISELKVRGPEGTIIKLKHGEQLDSSGHVDLSNIVVHYRPTDDKDPFQTDILILDGKGETTFSPRFNYKGFQYVEVTSSAPIKLTKESLTGYFVHSDVPVRGHIKTSNPLINKIWAATNQAYLSNLQGYPTDCPQREKNGWTGDAHIAIETGLYNFDGITIYEKWLADHRDEQQPNGVLPSIIPTSGWGYEWGNGPDWTSTIAIIPWNIYLFYGDKKLLADCYDNIKRYVDHITSLAPSGLTTWGLGDWVPVKSKTPVEFTSSIYYHTDVVILSKAAALLGKKGDAQHYRQLATFIQQAFNKKYFDSTKALYGSGLQTELSAALYWNMVPSKYKKAVAANLAARVKADNQLDVGLLGTKTILNALSENGYANLAYQLAARKTFPSWGWWIVNGATTLYENWDINAKNDLSRNHIMFGEIGAWLYKGLGGIKPDEQQPGFRHVQLHPNFVDSLDSFEAMHEGPYGKIISKWTREMVQPIGGEAFESFIYNVTIPAGSTATVTLDANKNFVYYMNKKIRPARTTGSFIQEIGPGKHTFAITPRKEYQP